MSKPFLIVVFSLFSMSLFSQSKVESTAYNIMLKTLLSHTVKEVSVDDVKGDPNVVFIDAREKKEFDVSRIKGATWVGYDDFKMKRMSEVRKDAKVVVYCSVGYRSEKVSEKLIAEGYQDVSNLYGGIFEWKNEGQPVYTNEKETEKVHAFDKTWGIWLNKGEKVYD